MENPQRDKLSGDRPLRQLIDACRPGSDDLQQGEMRPLAERIASDPVAAQRFERSQRLDAALASMFHDVPVPAGLQERLLAALDRSPGAASAPVSPAVDAAGETADAALPDESAVGPPPRGRRRVWLLAASALAVAAAALVAALAWWPTADVLGETELVRQARRWPDQLDQQAWQSAAAPVSEFPVGSRVPSRVRRWQVLRPEGIGQRVCCYDLQVRDGGGALLFVTATAGGFDLPPSPPPTAACTLDQCVAVWSNGTHAYVLIFQGDGRYRRIVSQPSSVACLPRAGLFAQSARFDWSSSSGQSS